MTFIPPQLVAAGRPGGMGVSMSCQRRFELMRYYVGDLEELRAEAEGRAGELHEEAFKRGFAKERLIEAELRKMKLERVVTVPEEKFIGFWSDEDLDKALGTERGRRTTRTSSGS